MRHSIHLPTLLLILGLIVQNTAAAGPILLGKEWRQLSDTSDISWNIANSVCSPDGISACDGFVQDSQGKTVNLSDWVWATKAQVVELFTELFISSGHGTYRPDSSNLARASNFTTQFFDEWGFVPTFSNISERSTWGLTSTTYDKDLTKAWLGYIKDTPSISFSDIAATNAIQKKEDSFSHVGLWLWKKPNSISEPNSLSLFAFFVFGLTVIRHRFQHV